MTSFNKTTSSHALARLHALTLLKAAICVPYSLLHEEAHATRVNIESSDQCIFKELIEGSKMNLEQQRATDRLALYMIGEKFFLHGLGMRLHINKFSPRSRRHGYTCMCVLLLFEL